MTQGLQPFALLDSLLPMSMLQDSAFATFLRSASEQAQVWVHHWLLQLKEALRLQEQEARSFVEKQSMGLSRSVLADYCDEVAKRFLAEIDVVIKDSRSVNLTASGEQKPSTINLDALSLVDHDEVQEKVDLTRAQQVVRMAAEEALPALNALLSRARGFDVVRTDVNPLHPDAVVAALSRALATLHLDDTVRAQWLQTGAVLLGAELSRSYVAMASALVQLGVKPAGYVVVQRSDSRSTPASHGLGSEVRSGESALRPSGPNLGPDQLHQLLSSTLKTSTTGEATHSGQSQGLACSLASEVVTQMMQGWAADDRLLPKVRDIVKGLQPALMQLARAQPDFFADPANPARRLLDAIALQGAVFATEFDAGFGEFSERTRRVLGALQNADTELPARMVAAMQRFRGPAFTQPAQRQGQIRPAAPSASLVCPTEEEDPAEELNPAFVDTLPMGCELMIMGMSSTASWGGGSHFSAAP
jgi:hypothetical protein